MTKNNIMTTLASILKKQTVRIDNHDSGSGRPFKWGTGVHLHKIMNEKKYKGAEFTLPLDSTNGKINDIRGNSSSIKTEIRKAFKDESVRNKFIKSFGDALEKISIASKFDDRKRTQMLTDSSRNLIALFGMDFESKKDWFRSHQIFMSMFSSPSEDSIYFEQNIEKGTITMSDNDKYIELFDDILKDYQNEDDMGG